MSEFLDMMLRPEATSVAERLPTQVCEIKRLTQELGAPVRLTLRALPYGQAQQAAGMKEDQDVMILLAGCPELKEPALQQKFGGATPAETVKRMFLPGEILDLCHTVERLSGYRSKTIEEIKNDSGRAETEN